MQKAHVYLSVSKVKNATASKASFDLRYAGQSIAELIVEKKTGSPFSRVSYEVTLTIDSERAQTNQEHFNFPPKNEKVICGSFDWNGETAKRFRKHFHQDLGRAKDAKGKNQEHKFESVILTDMRKTKSVGKKLIAVQPVLLCGERFQMPTPIQASNVKNDSIKYAKQYGGGIDILARAGTGGKATNLCVIEVKDENTSSESPQVAMKQAIAYATFIRELLRASNGKEWWNLFGFRGEIPESLTIFTVVAMPEGTKDEVFEGAEIAVGDQDKFVLHYIFIDSETGEPIRTTLPNSKM